MNLCSCALWLSWFQTLLTSLLGLWLLDFSLGSGNIASDLWPLTLLGFLDSAPLGLLTWLPNTNSTHVLGQWCSTFLLHGLNEQCPVGTMWHVGWAWQSLIQPYSGAAGP